MERDVTRYTTLVSVLHVALLKPASLIVAAIRVTVCVQTPVTPDQTVSTGYSHVNALTHVTLERPVLVMGADSLPVDVPITVSMV